MANPKKINLRVLLVALALLACGTMALGGTFATGINKDDAREDLSTDNTFEYKNIHLNYFNPQTGKYDLDFLNSAALTNAPWCPGYTQIVYLAVKNDEDFPVKCSLNMNVKTNEFGNNLKYAVIPRNLKAEGVDHPDSWAEFEKLANGSTVLEQDDYYIFNDRYLSFPTAENANDNTKHFALAIHMAEETSNQYQGKKLEMDFEFRVNTNWTPGATPAFTPKPKK